MSNANDFVIKNCELIHYRGCNDDVVIPESVTKIGERAFSECNSLRSVRIPEGVTNIGHAVFYGCNNLKAVVLPNTIKSIDTWWFMGCNSLEMIVSPGVPMGLYHDATISYYYADLAKTLKTAAAMGFLFHHEQYTEPAIATKYKEYIVAHKKEIIPLLLKNDTVEGIAGYAALGKINLRNFESEFLKPAQAVGASQCCAFLLDWKQKNLPTKTVDQELNKALGNASKESAEAKKLWSTKKLPNGTLEIINYKGTERNVTFPAMIGKQTVSRISHNGTYGCYLDLQEITISDGIKYITPDVCSHNPNLTRVTLPENITVGSFAFKNCKNLWQVTTHNNCIIEDWAFYRCNQLANTEGFAILGETLVGYYGNKTQITLPKTVYKIGAGAFENCKDIENIELHDHVVQIGPGAFYGCEKLADKKGFVIVANVLYDYFGRGGTVAIPDGVTEISENAFSRCKTLKSIIIPPSVTRIRGGAFYDCEKLEDISLPENDIEIDSRAFGLNKKLADQNYFLIVQDKLFACFSCSGDLKIPKGVKVIDSNAFAHNNILYHVRISEGVTTIGDEAFYYCSKLRTVEIPESVIEIGENAFANCRGLLIYAPAGSYAETYAKRHNIPFVAE